MGLATGRRRSPISGDLWGLVATDKWVDLGKLALTQLLEERHAVVWQEALGRISYQTDDRFPAVQAYQLGLARDALEGEGRIVVEHTQRPQLVTLRLAARPPGLSAREWNRLPGQRRNEYMPHRRWVGSPPAAGRYAERVLVASLMHFSAGRLIVRDRGVGNVTQVEGVEIGFGQSLDVLAYATSPVVTSRGVNTVPLVFESKNVYEWLYPWSPEPWELLVKAARLAVGGMPVTPVLACVRSGFQLVRMGQDLGFLLAWYGEQLLNPDHVDSGEVDYLRSQLGLAIAARSLDDPLPTIAGFREAALNEVRNPTTNRSVMACDLARFRFQRIAPVILEHAQAADGRPHGLAGTQLRAFAAAARREADWEFKGRLVLR